MKIFRNNPASEKQPLKAGEKRVRLLVLLLIAAFVFLLLIRISQLFFNNSSLQSDSSFSASIDRSIEDVLEWVRSNRIDILQRPNAALLKMLDDCNKIYPNSELEQIVNQFMNSPSRPDCYKALIDPNHSINERELNATIADEVIDNKWILYAIGKDKAEITAEEVGLFDYDKWQGRKLTHQLWALIHLRERSAENQETNELIEHLCDRLTKELFYDTAVVDIYIQKIAFVLGAGHPEKIRRRWVERVIEDQGDDGGWNDQWYCFKSARRPAFKSMPTNRHATVQALWLLYQVKYKYPEYFGLAEDN